MKSRFSLEERGLFETTNRDYLTYDKSNKMRFTQRFYFLRKVVVILFLLLSVVSCRGFEDQVLPSLPADVEAISLLGDTLRIPDLPDDIHREYSENLELALRDYRLDPEDAEAIIRVGRRLAYLGNYRDAVRTYSEGIYKHPDDARFYRHRGHRYITLRLFDKAIEDLETAVSLMRNQPDVVEPDGLPNERNETRSTLHTNVWYHLGLARYLKGDFEAAIVAFSECLNVSANDDMRVAALYWYYMAERRNGNDEIAGTLLESIHTAMDIIENEAYHQLLLVFKGLFDANRLMEATQDALQNATVGYGIGNWHYINGRTGRAIRIWEDILETGNWPAFGFIAAEAELVRE